ncbi:phosphatidylglycerophosphatase A [Iodidimonas muriae]|uniref:Phosphatidylglycerophosphatase A n=1 Tax=Iodidimonas muriae TaxID=261467 RepID=A0ABQ2L7Q0_9PROT|nr:phosphatidylglycerophosphatase A [Iodidimonas muriae]GER08113.1 phosphatidylglycerophosphatase A [Kordiimonadales bacterium JCM 17843]GGO06101.1 phosphatidylglycerophosphatase A [Iodidimonas muriae]
MPLLARAIATLFGIGFLKPGPGTWGSLAAALLAFPIVEYLGIWWLVAGTLLVSTIGIWAAEGYERLSGRHDPKEVVIDEVAGQWLTYLPMLFFANISFDWRFYALGFACFRLFDILKPWPIRTVDQQLPGGVGTMADDLLAAIPAAFLLWGLYWGATFI